MFTTIKKITAGLFCATALFSTNLMAIQFSMPGNTSITRPVFKKNLSCEVLPKDTAIKLRIQGISGSGMLYDSYNPQGQLIQGKTGEISRGYYNETIRINVFENSIVKMFNDIPQTVTLDCTIL